MKTFFSLSFLFFGLFQLHAQGIEFRDISYQQALEASRSEGKPLFVDCYTSWCGPCKWMAANMFPLKELGDYFNQNFICLKMDAEKGEGVDFVRKFGVYAYPTLLIINENEELLNLVTGAFREPEQYVAMGEKARDPERNMLYLKANKEAHFADREFMEDYLETFGMARMLEENDVDRYFAQWPVETWTEGKSWRIIRDFSHDPHSEVFQSLRQNEEDLPAKVSGYLEDVIYRELARSLSQSKSDSLRASYEEYKLQMLSPKIKNNDRLVFRISTYEYQKDGKWEDYCHLCVEKVKEFYWDSSFELYSAAYNVYNNTSNPEYLKEALRWSKRTVKGYKHEKYLYLYAHLLMKNGQDKKALKAAKEAVEVAKSKDKSTKLYEKFVAELEAGQKS